MGVMSLARLSRPFYQTRRHQRSERSIMIRLVFGLVAIVWFFASSPRATAQTQTLSAESGGVVIGRDAKDTRSVLESPGAARGAPQTVQPWDERAAPAVEATTARRVLLPFLLAASGMSAGRSTQSTICKADRKLVPDAFFVSITSISSQPAAGRVFVGVTLVDVVKPINSSPCRDCRRQKFPHGAVAVVTASTLMIRRKPSRCSLDGASPGSRRLAPASFPARHFGKVKPAALRGFEIDNGPQLS